MALEVKAGTGEEAGGEEENAEYVDMRRRFWVSLIFSVPVFVIAMGEMLPGRPFYGVASARVWGWVMMALSTPVIWWCGWPFLVQGVAVGGEPAFEHVYTGGIGGVGGFGVWACVVATVADLPNSFRMHGGVVAIYFEAAAVIVSLVLLGQVLELKARS